MPPVPLGNDLTASRDPDDPVEDEDSKAQVPDELDKVKGSFQVEPKKVRPSALHESDCVHSFPYTELDLLANMPKP
jgi:hypothetical protein